MTGRDGGGKRKRKQLKAQAVAQFLGAAPRDFDLRIVHRPPGYRSYFTAESFFKSIRLSQSPISRASSPMVSI